VSIWAWQRCCRLSLLWGLIADWRLGWGSSRYFCRRSGALGLEGFLATHRSYVVLASRAVPLRFPSVFRLSVRPPPGGVRPRTVPPIAGRLTGWAPDAGRRQLAFLRRRPTLWFIPGSTVHGLRSLRLRSCAPVAVCRSVSGRSVLLRRSRRQYGWARRPLCSIGGQSRGKVSWGHENKTTYHTHPTVPSH